MKFLLLAFLLLFAPSFALAEAQLTVQWRPGDNSAITGYRLERAPASPPGYQTWTVVAIVGSQVKRYVDAGLANNTMYQYRICAYNDVGLGRYSNVVVKVTRR